MRSPTQTSGFPSAYFGADKGKDSMEFAPRADRNMGISGASSVPQEEVSAHMQTARKPRPTAKDESARRERAELRTKATHSFTDLILFVVVFGCYELFVNSLEGIDADTTFLALFSTVLTVFIVKSVWEAITHWGQAD
ncbi:MAG TPA: hypothetical protein V6D22_12820 [Candidatus Obscuribacterales bacterium]